MSIGENVVDQIDPPTRRWPWVSVPAALSVLALAGCGSAARDFPGLSHARIGRGDETLQLGINGAKVLGDHKLVVGLNMDCGKSGHDRTTVTLGDTVKFSTYMCDTPEHDTITIKPGDVLYGVPNTIVQVHATNSAVRWAVNATETGN